MGLDLEWHSWGGGLYPPSLCPPLLDTVRLLSFGVLGALLSGLSDFQVP